MHEREMLPHAEMPRRDGADQAKRRWSAPRLTALDAKETLSGAPSTLEEGPFKPGS